MAVILVVDDNEFIREAAELMIQDCGYHTLSASDADEALSLLSSTRQIDALFTDIELKYFVFGGCELAQQSVVLRPKLRVLYTSGHSATDELKALFIEGAQFLRKPYTHRQLRDRFAALLAA